MSNTGGPSPFMQIKKPSRKVYFELACSKEGPIFLCKVYKTFANIFYTLYKYA